MAGRARMNSETVGESGWSIRRPTFSWAKCIGRGYLWPDVRSWRANKDVYFLSLEDETDLLYITVQDFEPIGVQTVRSRDFR